MNDMEITDLLNHWTAQYEQEYVLEEQHEDAMRDLMFDDLMEALDETYTG